MKYRIVEKGGSFYPQFLGDKCNWRGKVVGEEWKCWKYVPVGCLSVDFDNSVPLYYTTKRGALEFIHAEVKAKNRGTVIHEVNL